MFAKKHIIFFVGACFSFCLVAMEERELLTQIAYIKRDFAQCGTEGRALHRYYRERLIFGGNDAHVQEAANILKRALGCDFPETFDQAISYGDNGLLIGNQKDCDMLAQWTGAGAIAGCLGAAACSLKGYLCLLCIAGGAVTGYLGTEYCLIPEWVKQRQASLSQYLLKF